MEPTLKKNKKDVKKKKERKGCWRAEEGLIRVEETLSLWQAVEEEFLELREKEGHERRKVTADKGNRLSNLPPTLGDALRAAEGERAWNRVEQLPVML